MIKKVEKAIEKTEAELSASKWIGSLGPCWDIGQCADPKNFLEICTTTSQAKREIQFIEKYDPVSRIPRIKGLVNDGLPETKNT